MASTDDTVRGSTTYPDFSANYKETAGGTINLNRFVKIATDGDVEQGTFNAKVCGVLRSVYTNAQTATASDKVSVGWGRVACVADQVIVAGQALKCGSGGKATQLVDSALAGTTIEDNVGLAFTNQPANDGVEILSDSASDVQVATVYGTTTGTDTVVTEAITLTGTSAVSTVKTDWGVILAVKVASAAVGTITFREASANQTITTIAPAATSKGLIAVTAGQEKAYNVAPTAVGNGASTKQIGLLGTDEDDAVLTDSQALTGTVPVVMNDTFKTVTHLMVGDVESGVTVTVKVGAEDSMSLYAGFALEAAAAAGDLFDAFVVPTAVTSGSLDVLESVTAGLVSPGKAVVVDSNKDIGDFRNLDAVNIDAGLSGTAGTVDIFPGTAAKGKLALTAADSSGDTVTTIVNASQATTRTYTIPDAGGNASFVMTEGTQTINGTKTIPAIVTTNLDAGASGTAGTIDIFPATASRGKAQFDVTEQTGDTTVTHRTAAMGQATVITTPDPGAAAASVVLTEGTQTINGAKTWGGSQIRTGVERQLGIASAKAGATAGWVVNGAANFFESTLPATQTGSTLVIPVQGLKVGDTITAFKVEAQIESAGNTATLDADLRAQTNAAGDPTDASIGAITQVSVIADTKVETAKTALAEVVAADKWYYILITATTAAATDIRFLGCTVTVTES